MAAVQREKESTMNDYRTYGEKIASMINASIASGDFRGMSRKVSELTQDAVNRAGEEIRSHFHRDLPSAFRRSAVNKAAAVAGTALSAALGIASLVVFLVMLALAIHSAWPVFVVFTVIFGALTGLFSYGIFRFREKWTAWNNCRPYADLVGNRAFVELEELAKRRNLPLAKTRKEVRGMLRCGIIPQGRMDESEQLLFLTGQAYEEFSRAAYVRQKQNEEQKEMEAQLTEDARRVLAEGGRQLTEIRELTERMQDPQMKKEISDLGRQVEQILAQARRNPSAISRLRRFVSYYLPTTVKMLHVYADIEARGLNTDNAKETKREIRETMRTIHQAFDALLQDLVQDMSWDIQSDLSAMKTMMEQDGLTDGRK
jgi:5-bromo-4-chloroindolyl phosphate hydrolysis protein